MWIISLEMLRTQQLTLLINKHIETAKISRGFFLGGANSVCINEQTAAVNLIQLSNYSTVFIHACFAVKH